jgi:hypothetical protein
MARRGFLLITAGALCGLLATGTAHGTDSARPWPGGPVCAEGGLTGRRTTTEPVRTELAAWIRPCAGTDPAVVAASRWGMATFTDTDAFIAPGSIQRFAGGEATSLVSFRFADGDPSVTGTGGIRAVCLVTALATRVTCARISASGEAGTIVVTPLPTGDPLVGRGVRILPGEPTDPACATCV